MTRYGIELDQAPGTSRRGERSEPVGGEDPHPTPLGNSKEIGVRKTPDSHFLPPSSTLISSSAPTPHVEGYRPSDLAERNRIKDRSMRWLRSFSVRSAAAGCMVDPIAGTVKIRVSADTGRGHVSGVKRCASPWSCPTCSFKIRNRRATELTELVEAATSAGGSALLLTVTLPHGPSEALSTVLGDLQASWRAMWAGRWAKDLRARYGIVGTVRAIEVTWGAGSGWHPHTHAVLVLDRAAPADAELVALWGALMFRWAEVVKGTTDRAVNIARALDLRVVDDPRNVAEYVTDAGSWSVGAEVASGPVKMGKSAGRWSPFSLLAAAACWGDADAGRLWSEYEQATAGKRAIVASRGLYARYGIGQATEEEAAEGPEVENLLVEIELDPLHWYALGAVDAQRAYVTAVEVWAADGARGDPPHPVDTLTEAVKR
jgi:hypothetical protein